MTPRLDAIRERVEAANQEVFRLCKGGAEHFRMSIPADPKRDSDLILIAALDDTEHLLTEVERLRGVLTEIALTGMDVPAAVGSRSNEGFYQRQLGHAISTAAIALSEAKS